MCVYDMCRMKKKRCFAVMPDEISNEVYGTVHTYTELNMVEEYVPNI